MDDRFGGGITLPRAEGRPDQVVDIHRRDQMFRGVGRQHLGGDAKFSLRSGGARERREVVVVVEEHEIADLFEVDRYAGEFLEAGELLERSERQASVKFVVVLDADAAGRLARRTGAEPMGLHEDRVGPAELREVIERARAHTAATDDHCVCSRHSRFPPVGPRRRHTG